MLTIELYSLSLVYLSNHYQYSCGVGPLLSKIRITEHKHHDTVIVGLITWEATRRLRSRWHIYCVHADKGMMHVLGQLEQDNGKLNHDIQKGSQFKTYKLCISRIGTLLATGN